MPKKYEYNYAILYYYNKKIKATVGKPSVLEASTLLVRLSHPLRPSNFTLYSLPIIHAQYNPSTGMYVRTGIGDAGESHGKALGRVTHGGVPLYVPVLVRYCIHLVVYVSLACV